MRRIRIAGLCLVAICAMSLIASASASAFAPEIGRCVKKAKAEGTGFSEAKCLKAGTGTTAKYEWKAGPEAGKGNFTTSGGTSLLETKGGKKVKCTSEESTGTFSNATEETTTVEFSGCESAGLPCTTAGKTEGHLATEPLVGTFADEKPATEKSVITVLKLKPVSGEFFIKFKCIGLSIEVGAKGVEKGEGATQGNGILVKIKNDAMHPSEILKYTQTKGVQKPDVETTGPSPTYLESSFEKTKFEQSGQTVTSTVKYETTYELKAKE